MKTVGILGGVGPQTTSKVYHSIIDLFRIKDGKKYPSILIYNLPFPFSVENEIIVEGKNSSKMLPYLIEGAKILEKSGANFGILPCNTLHKYIEDIRESVKIPFLSILEETALKLKNINVDKVGILATETTVKDKLYNNILEQQGIEIIYPTNVQQNEINNVIMEILNNKENKNQQKVIKKICSSLYKRGAKAILLACTDLQIIVSDRHASIPILDTTDILISSSVKRMLDK